MDNKHILCVKDDLHNKVHHIRQTMNLTW